jgi:L-ascorbate metabolism protein UlaG (beta-lactamase superfamily)
MLKPVQQDGSFLVDVVKTRGDQTDALRLWWLGQSGFMLQHKGRHLLFDPYLSDSLTKKYAETEKPHVRMTERVIAPEKLNFIDVVTSTHNHTDHLDAETLLPLIAANPKMQLVLPAANQVFAYERLHEATNLHDVPLEFGVPTNVGPFRFVAVPAAHSELTSGYAGYVVKVGPHTVYHSGDTVVFDGMSHLLKLLSIDIAILPINGKVDNMGGRDAAQLAKDIGAKLVIPCHYEMFEFNTADPAEQFVPACQELGQPFKVLRAGEKLTVQPGGVIA